MINFINKDIEETEANSVGSNNKELDKDKVNKVFSWIPEKTKEQIIPIISSLNVNNFSKEELENRKCVLLSDLSEEEEKLLNYYYYDLQDVANDTEEERVVLNTGRYKATLLMSKLLEKTNNSIAMVVGRMEGAVSDQDIYIDAFKRCIPKAKHIDITFLDEPNPNSKLIALLKSEKAKGFPINFYRGTKKTEQEILNFFNKEDKVVHFSIYDNDKCRVEIDPEGYVGYGMFNNELSVSKLLNFYKDKIITTSNSITL